MPESMPAQPAIEIPLAPVEVSVGASPLEVAGQAWLEKRFLPPDVNVFAKSQGKTNEYSTLHDVYTQRINEAKEQGITGEAITEEAIRQATVAAKEAYSQSVPITTAIRQELATSGRNIFSIPPDDPRRVALNKLDTTIYRARKLGITPEIIEGKTDTQR